MPDRPSFWNQPSNAYRNFAIAYALLTLNFVIPAFAYSFAPHAAMDQFLAVNDLFGGAPYGFPEAESRVWRYLAAANVMTLGAMCLLLLLDLRSMYPILVPLTFMKMYAATAWLFGWLNDRGAMFFLAAAILDYGTSAAFVYFARTAKRAIATVADAQLVPRPKNWFGK